MTTRYHHLSTDRINAQIEALTEELRSRQVVRPEPVFEETPVMAPETAGEPSWLSSEGYVRNGGFVVPGTQRKAKPTGTGSGLKKDIRPLTPVKGEVPKAAPADKPITQNRVISTGFYSYQDTIAQVVLSKQSRPYAKVLTDGSWVYTPGLVSKLSQDDVLTYEAACAYGLRTHTCGICGRELTNDDSIKIGIGPICRGKMGW